MSWLREILSNHSLSSVTKSNSFMTNLYLENDAILQRNSVVYLTALIVLNVIDGTFLFKNFNHGILFSLIIPILFSWKSYSHLKNRGWNTWFDTLVNVTQFPSHFPNLRQNLILLQKRTFAPQLHFLHTAISLYSCNWP